MRVTSQNYLHTTTYINMSMSYKYLGNSLLNKLQRKDTSETKKPFRVSRYFEEETGRTLPKFYQVPSSSSISQYKPAQSPKLAHHFSQNKIFNKLAVELETIQQNIGNRQNRKRKLSFARQKLLTEASVDPKKTIYNKILEQINQIKVKNRLKSSTSDILSQVSSGDFSRAKQSRVCQDEKTLFYGVDEIDRVLYKIKIKLSKSYYRLYAKNKNSKIMMELSYNEYMKLHFGELKGNPCNILPMLKIKNNQLTLVLRNSLDRSRAKSFKSYLGFY